MQDYEKDKKVPSHRQNQLEYNNLTNKIVKRISKYNKIYLESSLVKEKLVLDVITLGRQR